MSNEVVKADVTSLEKLAQRLARPEALVKEMAESAIKTAGAELLRRTMMKTPRITSNLARRWTDHETPLDQEAKDIPIEQYIKKTPVEQKGNSYFLTISNSTEYAPYVEYGHRKTPHWVPGLQRIGKKWVMTGDKKVGTYVFKHNAGWKKGEFMLTKSIPEVERMLPGIVEQKMNEYFGDLFNG